MYSRPFPLTVFHQEGPCQACDESAPLPPLPEFQKVAALVSETSTKLAALFSSPPTLPSPMNCTAAVCAVEQAAATLTATYHHISPIYGWLWEGFSTPFSLCSCLIVQYLFIPWSRIFSKAPKREYLAYLHTVPIFHMISCETARMSCGIYRKVIFNLSSTSQQLLLVS